MAKGDWLGGIQTVTPAAVKNLVKPMLRPLGVSLHHPGRKLYRLMSLPTLN